MADNLTQQMQGDPPEYAVKGCESISLMREAGAPLIFERHDQDVGHTIFIGLTGKGMLVVD